ncbi:MAG: SLBB domain-containing protein [Bacteroidota bacterium]
MNTLTLHVLLVMVLGIAVLPAPGGAQIRGRTAAQAEPRLAGMTAREIDRKLGELGLSRDEAARQAAAMGIPLEQFVGSLRPRRESVSVPQEGRLSTDSVDEAGFPGEEAGEEKAPDSLRIPRDPTGLPYFGYDLFLHVPKAFEPAAAGPADPEYLIGPSDLLRLSVWGQVEFQTELAVDREGRVFVPTVGQVPVSGLTLEGAYQKLLKQMSRSYAGLLSEPPTAWLDLSLARMRPKRVFLMGEVARPGGYTVGSYSTVFNVLYSVGGPTANGSLREVRLIRGGRVIARVDLYDYLTGAETTNDIRVQSNDIVYIPPRARTVSLRGEVRHPAVFELVPGEGIASLVRFAGGLLPTAYEGYAQVDRIRPLAERKGGVDDRMVIDIPLRDLFAVPPRDHPLEDGDQVMVFPVLDEKRNYASIEGAVWKPGRYQIGELKRIRDLIAAARGLHPKAHMGLAHLTRLNPDRLTRRILPLDLQQIMADSGADVFLEAEDAVTVYSTEILEVKDRFVTVRGSIKKPGRYPLRTSMTLGDLIPMAGGYTEDAELLAAEVARVLPRGFGGDSLALILRPALPQGFAGGQGGGVEFPLLHRDEVLVLPNPTYVRQRNVIVSGDIRYPGVYAIQRRGERVSEILNRAGGPTSTSSMGGAQFFRKDRRLLLDLRKAYEDRDVRHDVVMLDGDSLHIPSRPHTVLVTGEVNNPGLLSFIEGDDVQDYIDRAGGLTDSSLYAVLVQPTGESRRVDFGWFRGNPEVPEGSTVAVLKIPPPGPEGEPFDVSGTIKDVFAILSSAATLAFIVWQVSQ